MMKTYPFILLIILSLILPACAIKDDFGRTKDSAVRANVIEAVGSIQEHTGLFSNEAAFHIPFSGDELTLRMTLKHFRRPYLAQPILRDPVKTEGLSKRTHGESFQASILHNIKSDINRIAHFERAVQRVIAQDRQRYEVISHKLDVADNDSRYIRVRIRENRAVTMRVIKLLDKRTASYDKAIEYAGLQYPRKTFQPIIPQLDLLRTRISNLNSKYESYVYLEGNYEEEVSRRETYNGTK